MKLTERIIDITELAVSPEQEAPRTDGCHVSSIINYISASLGRRENTFSRDDLNLFALLGRVFEVVLAKTLFPSPRYERLGELECDGIIGSPDAFDTEEMAVVEMKATWKSSKREIESFSEYWWQLKSYCKMTQTKRAVLVVFFVCGNYAPPVPQLRCWEAEFTASEIEGNWEMIKQGAQQQ